MVEYLPRCRRRCRLSSSSRNIELAVSRAKVYAAKRVTTRSAFWLTLGSKAVLSSKVRRERDMATLNALEGYLDVFALPY